MNILKGIFLFIIFILLIMSGMYGCEYIQDHLAGLRGWVAEIALVMMATIGVGIYRLSTWLFCSD